MPRAKKEIIIAAFAGAACSAAALSMIGASPTSAAIEPDRTSYAIGYDLGVATLDRLQMDGVSFDRASLMQGFDDAMNGAEPVYPAEELDAALSVLQREVATRIAEARMEADPVFRALIEQNRKASSEFIAAFAAKENSVKLPSGVVYEAVSSGDGPSPEADDTVRVSFRARLRDGTLIGDERELVVRLDGMIDGAQEAIMSMHVGDRRIVAIPPELAFGIGGREPDIGPNEAIIADVELLGIEP